MKAISQTKPIDVRALKLALMSQRAIMTNFKLPMTFVQARDTLLAAYAVEVEVRGKEFVSDDETVSHIHQLARWATDEDDPRFGCLMCGDVGNGKTTMMLAMQSICNHLADNDFIEQENRVVIVNAKDIARYAKDDKMRKRLEDLPMLGIDDLGVEPAEVLEYGNVINPAVDLLCARYDNRMWTMVTTNLKPDQIRKKYGDRVADRFKEMFIRIVHEQKSYRESGNKVRVAKDRRSGN